MRVWLGLWLLTARAVAAPASPPPPAPLSAPPASPADAERARQLFAAGSEAYEKGRYDVAIGAFETALQLNPGPAMHFSLAQALRLQFFVDRDIGGLERAIAEYRAYLDQTPEGGRRDHAAQHLATLAPILEGQRLDAATRQARAANEARLIVTSRTPGASARVDESDPSSVPATFLVEIGPRKVTVEAPNHVPQTVRAMAVAGTMLPVNLDLSPVPGRVVLRAPEGAGVVVDGQPRGITPLAGPLEIPPGRHAISMGRNGAEPVRREIELAPGGEAEVAATLEPTARRWTALGLFATGGALAVGSGLGLLQAWSKGDDAESLRARYGRAGFDERDAARYAELRDDRDSWRAAGIGLAVGAGVTLGVAALLYAFDEPDLAAAAAGP